MLSITPGENGVIKSKKGIVPIKDIRNIDLVRNPLNLINDIVIETFNDQKIKIRTYNLIGDFRYQIIVDQYIYP
ncbi:DUF5381 family protein, partial [Escherichia coli]|nr:DUF5381 family protein [Escherichia coli]